MLKLAGAEPEQRRADYAARVTACLTASAVPAQAWPRAPESHRLVYVDRATPVHGAPGVVVEFEPDLPLDPDGSWTARILVPQCCRTPDRGEAVEVELDRVDAAGMVAVRGARTAAVAAQAAQAWADHAAHLYADRGQAAAG